MTLISHGGFRPFPDAHIVFFCDEVGRHRSVLQPLLSLDVELRNPGWKGKLHFVLPIEPWDGGLGEEREQFHGPNCGHNWIKFSVSGSKYRFVGDFRFFKINHAPDREAIEMYGEFENS